jgi:glycerol-3-phosphate dehydrogenase
VIFVNPYEGDLALIGTTDIAVDGDPEEVAIEPAEIDYLLAVVNRYFARDLSAADVVDSFAGVRPLYDDEAANPSAITRDYAFEVEPERPAQGLPPLLSVLGGKITTYRKLAEHALEKLAPFLGELGPAWTAAAPLPGGDMANADFEYPSGEDRLARGMGAVMLVAATGLATVVRPVAGASGWRGSRSSVGKHADAGRTTRSASWSPRPSCRVQRCTRWPSDTA